MLNLLALKVTIGLSRVKEVSQYNAYLPELGQDGYYRGADKPDLLPDVFCFDGETISFDTSLVIYI